MIDSDEINRMIVEIVTGKIPATPDDAEHAAMRAQLAKECNDIRRRGYDVDIPSEISDL